MIKNFDLLLQNLKQNNQVKNKKDVRRKKPKFGSPQFNKKAREEHITLTNQWSITKSSKITLILLKIKIPPKTKIISTTKILMIIKS